MGVLLSVIRVLVLLGTAYVLYTALKNYLGRSPLDNIPGPPSASWLKGNLGQLYHRAAWDFNHELGLKYGGVVKIHGMFGTRQLFVHDPAALSNVVVKDQYIYEESSEFLAVTHVMFGDGLLATLGERHRRQRRLLNPVFSIAHMREMIPIFYRITAKLQEAIAVRVKDGGREIDMLDWMSRTALELVGQAGLGVSFDPLVNDKQGHNLGTAVKAVVPTLFSLRLLRPLLPLALRLGTPAFQRKMASLIPSKRVRRAVQISAEIESHSRRIYDEKLRALMMGDDVVLHQIAEGKDIMSRLIQTNMSANEEDKLPENELLGQVATFIFAGMDTTSNALARTLDLVSKHPDVQDKLRAEIHEAQREHGTEIPYDVLVELPYMDAVCRETLRLYAPVPNMMRKTREDVIMPLSRPIRGVDGSLITEIPVPKDTGVIIGILACNRNPDLWGADAAEWKPERWLNPLPEVVKDAHIPGVYSHLMTFLGGGRACIGFKFSQLEMKIVLAVLLSNFRFEPSGKEIFWNVGGIQYPTVGMCPTPEMPMRVSPLKWA